MQAYADLWVSPAQGGKPHPFTISNCHTPESVLSFLSLLSRTDAALPSLSSLSLPCAISTTEAADRLCSVLRHHRALEELEAVHLSFAPVGFSTPAAIVFRALPPLTGITALTLSAPCLPPSPADAATEAAAEAVQAMAAAIFALPQLQEFYLGSIASQPPQHGDADGTSTADGPAFTLKRRRLASCMGFSGRAATPPSLDPIIAALSTSPSLTSLSFVIPAIAFGRPLPCSGICGPFHTLRWLAYEGSDRVDAGGDGRAPLGMEILDTSGSRLPALTYLTLTNKSSACADDCGSLRRLLAAAPLLPALEAVVVRMGNSCVSNSLELDVCSCSAPRVSVRLECGITAQVAKVLQSYLPSLAESALTLKVRLQNYSDKSIAGVEHVAPILPPLATFTSLQELDFDVNMFSDYIRVKTLCCDVLSQPLQPLRLLTSLCLSVPFFMCMPLGIVEKQLQGMTQLRHLNVGVFKLGGADELYGCFAPLTALTRFVLYVLPVYEDDVRVTKDDVRAWARAVCAMPQLKEASFEACEQGHGMINSNLADIDWFRGLLELPSWGTYWVSCDSEETPEGELEAVRQQLIDRGADVADRLQYISFNRQFDPAEE